MAIRGNPRRLIKENDDVVVRIGETLAYAKVLSRTSHGCFVAGDSGDVVGVPWACVFVGLGKRETIEPTAPVAVDMETP